MTPKKKPCAVLPFQERKEKRAVTTGLSFVDMFAQAKRQADGAFLIMSNTLTDTFIVFGDDAVFAGTLLGVRPHHGEVGDGETALQIQIAAGSVKALVQRIMAAGVSVAVWGADAAGLREQVAMTRSRQIMLDRIMSNQEISNRKK